VPITPTQKAQAEQRQWTAAQDGAPQVRLVAGPGTGKSHTIEKRVAHLLLNGLIPSNVYVISFTRATCTELRTRPNVLFHTSLCRSGRGSSGFQRCTRSRCGFYVAQTCSLRNRVTPIILDDWVQTNVYDKELASSLRCLPSRAAEIRLAPDAQWQTLSAILKSSPNHAI
jgi:DNA helicase II / ATP-dependent DNA helicase PcrA